MTDGPLISLDKLSEPLTKLVKVVAAGIGGLYEPLGIVRKAKAEAKAAVIRAESAREVSTIEQRAAARVEYRESIRQENIEKITQTAAGALPEEVSPDPVDVDWTTQFIDGAQDVSDSEMQVLWGRILAGEVAKPGTYSKRVLGILRTLDKWEAEAFTELCSCAVQDENGWRYLIHGDPYEEYVRLKFESRGIESHFADIGLLMSDTGIAMPSKMSGKKVLYFGKEFRWSGADQPTTAPNLRLRKLEIGPGVRNFSLTGQQLAAIAGSKPLDNYVDKLSEYLNRQFHMRLDAQ
jgi:hypothetical protein